MPELLEKIRFDEHHFPPRKEAAHRFMQKVTVGYDRMAGSTIVLAGLARNVAAVLPATMLRMELLGRTFADYRIVIFENDSIDQTVPLLVEWAASNSRVEIVSESLGAPPSRPIRCSDRADRMAYYRRQCQTTIREKYSDAEYVGLIDTDVEGGWSPDGVASTFSQDGWDFVGSNGLIYKRRGFQANAIAHYDAWAYRDDTNFTPLSTKYVNRLRHNRGEPMVPLPSCFGGLGFYRMKAYLAGVYEGGDIEHVSFHRSMREQGYDRTFLNPDQIVVYGRKHRRMDCWLKRCQSLMYGCFLSRRAPWRFEKPLDVGQFEPHFRNRVESSHSSRRPAEAA